jgi:hypothetical protein
MSMRVQLLMVGILACSMAVHLPCDNGMHLVRLQMTREGLADVDALPRSHSSSLASSSSRYMFSGSRRIVCSVKGESDYMPPF